MRYDKIFRYSKENDEYKKIVLNNNYFSVYKGAKGKEYNKSTMCLSTDELGDIVEALQYDVEKEFLRFNKENKLIKKLIVNSHQIKYVDNDNNINVVFKISTGEKNVLITYFIEVIKQMFNQNINQNNQ